MDGDVVYGDDAAFVKQSLLLGSADFVLEEGSGVDFDVHCSNPIFRVLLIFFATLSCSKAARWTTETASLAQKTGGVF